jgi:hypothetical protein
MDKQSPVTHLSDKSSKRRYASIDFSNRRNDIERSLLAYSTVFVTVC